MYGVTFFIGNIMRFNVLETKALYINFQALLLYNQIVAERSENIIFFLVFIRIRWIGTGSHPYEKTMSSIVLYPSFYKYKNVQS